MELIKKTILQSLTTGTTATTEGTKYIIIPNLAAIYYMKIGLTSEIKDIGFFDVNGEYDINVGDLEELIDDDIIT